MGGGAFEGAARVPSRAELDRVAQCVMTALAHAGALRVGMPPELLDKATFGDIDLLVAAPPDPPARAALVRAAQASVGAGGAHVVRCGDLESFLCQPEQYQIDLLFVEPQAFDIACAARANGDTTWLLNLGLRQVGLKLSEKSFAIRGECCASDLGCDFDLSQDPAKIAAFLGLESRAFDGQSSLTLEQAFAAVTKSRFFRLADFRRFDTLDTSSSRRRVKRRPMLAAFRKWLAAESHAELLAGESVHETVSSVHASALAFFDLTDRFAVAQRETEFRLAEAASKRVCSDRVGGARIKELFPHLSGPDVGKVLALVRGDSWQTCAQWLASVADDAAVLDRIAQAVTGLSTTQASDRIF